VVFGVGGLLHLAWCSFLLTQFVRPFFHFDQHNLKHLVLQLSLIAVDFRNLLRTK